MKVGTLAFTTAQGLGFLVRDFHRHGIVTDVGIVWHGSRKNHPEWYPGALRIGGLGSAKEFIREVDVALFFETPFFWELIPFCRQHKIPTVLMTMYECTPAAFPFVPDHLLCPSVLDLQHFTRGTFIPVPVPEEIQFKQRFRARVFVHNAGNGGLLGRNGTKEVIEAIPHVKSDAQFLIRSQRPALVARAIRLAASDPRVTVEVGTIPFADLYSTGDVFLFPEKFNGLSLPLQEAFASGMPCMVTCRKPNTSYLPHEILIPPSKTETVRVAPKFRKIESSTCDPKTIARKIDEWFDRDISHLSLQGARYRWTNSWSVLGSRYKDYLNNALEGAAK